ncbi:uncharacterized protein LOC134259025 [Saccostrea cucullata]|uniref:uncharacterized protein LOC134259025 n=1 Tax=Saccostrea cuccullata TaxID=36930 RepID=UPI002ED1C667
MTETINIRYCWIIYTVFFWNLISILKTVQSCNFPTKWKDNVFRDSTSATVKENIHFYSSTVVWQTNIFGTNIAIWNCHDSSSQEIVMIGTNTVTHNSQTYYAYQCLLYTETSNATFYYFPVKNITDGNRVLLSTNPSLTVCDVCSSIEPELHIMSLQSDGNCNCTPSCSELTTTGSCSQSIDLSQVQCASALTTVTTGQQGGTTASDKKQQTGTVFTVEVIVILCASLFVLCLILVTSTVAIVIYNRNEQLKRRLSKIRKVRPVEHV